MANKKYGLILPDKGKQTLTFQASHNVFGNDSDSDEQTSKRAILLRPSDNINRQSKKAQEKAILEDPTVYQYDEIYDEVVSKIDKEKAKVKEEKKPRYIENLLKSANKRKLENERRVERQIQKEREQEGEEFKDKEVFVTSAYKKKLEEMRLEEEKEKREEYLESIGDVTKQNDLGGFYRHLYEQKLGTDKSVENKEVKNTSEPEPMQSGKTLDQAEPSKKRNYRKRKLSNETKKLSEGEVENSDEEINRVNIDEIRMAKRNKDNVENIDADSDFSIDDSSDEESDKGKENKKEINANAGLPTSVTADEHKKSPKPGKEAVKDNAAIKSEPLEPEPKIDIWKKRTVGELFDQALKRYYERKAARGV